MNGTLTARWITGVLIGILISFIGWAWIDLSAKVTTVSTIQSARGERIAALEVQVRLLEMTLGRMETKMDSLLERQRMQSVSPKKSSVQESSLGPV